MRQPPKDRPMFAPDMFLNDTQQVFSVRTGGFIGYYRPGMELPEVQHFEIDQLKTKDINQLTLEI